MPLTALFLMMAIPPKLLILAEAIVISAG